MRVALLVEFEVKPTQTQELTNKQKANIMGMLNRQLRNRINGFVGREMGGDRQKTGWEVTVQGFKIKPQGSSLT